MTRFIRIGLLAPLLIFGAGAIFQIVQNIGRLGPAEVFNVGFPFGGNISLIRPCSKPPGTLITVGPPIPGEYMVLARGTTVFPFRSIHPGAYVLGLAERAPIPCIAGVVPIGAGLPVLIMGTSL